MRKQIKKIVHKLLKTKLSTNTPKTNKSPVVMKFNPVPHTFWVRPNYSEAHRMYTIKKMNELGKTLIVMYRKNKESLEKIYRKLVSLK